MSKFIEEFYYGNIDPQARSTKQNKTVQKQMEVLMLNEEFLTEALTGENKKKFLDFVNAWSVVNGESNLDSFIMGFRLGANFAYDTFVATDTPVPRLAEGVNDMRNTLIANRKHTYVLDEVLLKVIHSKQKKLKIVYKEI